MPKINAPFIVKLLLGVLLSFALNYSTPPQNYLTESTTVSLPTPQQIEEIAKSVTVRILSNSVAGSGVIIERKGQIYTVITNRHVVANNSDNHYNILTVDGKIHQGKWLFPNKFPNLDLAVIEFKSSQFYQVAEFGNFNKLLIGETLYAAGFPNWQWLNKKEIESTQDWGNRAFILTVGKVGMLPKKSLKDGYQLGYTNDIFAGMSGGAVFNEFGKLVGINGRMKYPLSGIESFRFTDGTLPTQETFKEMEALSWGISVDCLK
ncbi:MAG: serine protease [Cuspidothrix sp.]